MRFPNFKWLAAAATTIALAFVTGLPAMADEPLDGTLLVIPDEPGPITINEDGSSFQGEGQAGGVFVLTDNNEFIEAPHLAAAEVETGMTVYGTTVAPQTVVPATVGPHEVDVIWLSRSGEALPSANDMQSAITRSADFWKSQSGGLFPGFATFTPQFKTTTHNVCDAKTAWQVGLSVTGRPQAEYTAPEGGRHLITLVSRDVCSGTGVGLGTVGSSTKSGGLVWVAVDPSRPQNWNGTLTHELGHNFGLWHSGAVVTAPGGPMDLPANVSKWTASQKANSFREYQDYYDVMGAEVTWTIFGEPVTAANNLAALNVTQKVLLGAAQPGSYIQQVTDAGGEKQTLTLNAASATSGTRALEIIDLNSGEKLYVDYRSGLGETLGVNEYESFYATAARLLPDSYFDAYRPGVRVLKILQDVPTNGFNKFSMVVQQPSTDAGYWIADEGTFTSLDGVKVNVVSTTNAQATVEVVFPSTEPLPFTTAPTPTITGTPKVGKTLTANPGSWAPTPDALTYQWVRGGTNIPGATSKTYTPVAADVGQQISVKVTATKSGYQTTTRTSRPVSIQTVQRFEGPTRYGTNYALNVARMKPGKPLFVATGASFPDALTIGPAVSLNEGSLVLAPSRGLDTQTLNLIRSRKPSQVYVVGGTSAVSEHVVSQLRSAAGLNPVRIGGSNRYETSTAVYHRFFASRTISSAFVATGADYPDALSAAAAGGALNMPVVLVKGSSATASLDPSVAASLKSKRATALVFVGGTDVIKPSVETNVRRQGFSVSRMSGVNRYGTNAAVNGYVDTKTGSVNGVWIATGKDFPDALSAAAPAGAPDQRLVLSNGNCVSAPPWINSAGEVTLVGGSAVLGPNVLIPCR